MAKIKENTRNVAAAKRATTKAKTTTPVKTINGKVHKLRVNVKNMKIIKSKEETSKINSIERDDQTISPKTRLCFVKLRRTLANDDTSSRSYNNNNNNNNTLQAQCNVLEKNNETEIKSPALEKSKTTRRSRKKSNEVINTATNLVAKKHLNGQTTKTAAALETLDNSVSNMSPSTINSPSRCFIKLKRTVRPTTRQQKEPSKAAGLKSQRNKRTSAKANILEPSTPNSLKNCVVKLKMTPLMPRSKELIEEPSTPTRNCLVRLKRTPAIEKANDVIEPTTPSMTRTCVVRLQRTPVSLENKENDECTERANTNYQSPIPQNKRDNFHKLSLTKSLRKSTENNQKETTINSNHTEKNKLETKTNNDKTETNNVVNPLKAQNCIKHLSKLSLRRSHVQNNRNITTNLEVTHFEPPQNSTIFFEPARNSTLLEFGFTKDKNKAELREKPNKVTSKDKSSSQNLANKSEEIVDLLNSLDEDDELLLKSPDKRNEQEAEDAEKILEIQNEKETQNNKSPPKHKSPHKFFHRNREELEENISKVFTEPKPKSPPETNAKKHRFLTKRSTMVKRDNIYEFLSQSQTSDSDGTSKHVDPTADIIKKLIDQGKVRVATNCKGKGKPVFKRRPPPPKQMKKIKPPVDKKLKNNKKKTTATKKPAIADDEVEVLHMEDDDFDNYEPPLPDNDYNMDNQRTETVNKTLNHNNNRHHLNDQEGTFSRLARSVLISEAGRSGLQRKNASLLLEMVKKFVSTPKNKQMPSPQAALESELSPIPMPPLRPPTKPSPWRVDEDAYLPKTFNFARSSGNLPSFSSDFIPSTPRKEKPKRQQQTTITSNTSPIIGNQNAVSSLTPLQSPLHNNVENIQAQTPNENVPPPPAQTSIQNEPSVLSSFSSNDSNAENMPPPRPLQENYNENENIFALKQLPNPRRALNYRSPLKAINILEVVHLPPYKSTNKTPNSKESGSQSIDMFGFEENLCEDSLQQDQSIAPISNGLADANIKTRNRPKEDLFGFEEFLSQTEYSSQENDETNNNDITTNGQNLTIHDKLQDLRKFKPAENELELSIQRGNNRNPLKTIPLFDEDAALKADGMRQRRIKEMLCSTLINPQPSTSKQALKNLKKSNWKHSKRPNFGEDLDISELFKDPEPETTFNDNDAHRTYIRPYKRKRRLKQNKYVMFLDSDESDDEHNSVEKQKHQRSHETDTSSEQQAPKKKRQRKEPKEKPEFTEFVDEFNEMCKEVDSYELIVEKSV